MRWVFFHSLFFFSICAEELPWLTGPLIAPVGEAIPYGEFLLKSYLFANAEKKHFINHSELIHADHNFYNVSFQGYYFFGITSWADLNIVPRFAYNCFSNQQSVQVGDFTIGLDIQLLAATKTPYFPGIKLAVRENFPTGNFEYLTPRKLMTDQTGTGSFATQFDLVFYKLFHLHKHHWLSVTFSNEYTVNAPVSINGFNTYGGGFGTKGTVIPGNTFKTILSFELSLNRYVAVALDNVYTFTNASQFFGIEGITFDGTLADVGFKQSSQVNFATSIEGNFSSHFGIIAGCYFSAFGENMTKFQSAVINFNYYY